eukprot:SAG31_NODE_4426_length_3244_cov_1.661367_1_plen_1041_part_00
MVAASAALRGWVARTLLLAAALWCDRISAQAPTLECNAGTGVSTPTGSGSLTGTLNGFVMTRTNAGQPHALITPYPATVELGGTTWNFLDDFAQFNSDNEVEVVLYLIDANGERSADYDLGSDIPAPIGTSTLYITATNRATGDSTSEGDCMAIISVNDLEAPSVTCPDDKDVDTDAGMPTATVTLQEHDENAVTGANYNDNSVVGGDLSILAVTISMLSVNGEAISASDATITPGDASFDIGITVVRYRVAHTPQNQGNTLSSTCEFEIRVTDNERPEIEAPDPTTVQTDAGSNTAVMALSLSNATASDNSGTVNVTSIATSGDGSEYTEIANAGTPTVLYPFPLSDDRTSQVTFVRYTAVDPYDNSRSDLFLVTVVDHEDPVVGCPADQDLSTGAGLAHVVVTITGTDATYTDNSEASDESGTTLTIIARSGSVTGLQLSEGAVEETHTLAIGSGGEAAEHEIYFTVEDASLNTGFCVMTITVTDREPPTLTCPYSGNGFTTAVVTDPGNSTHPMGAAYATLAVEDATVVDNSGLSIPFMATAQFAGGDQVVRSTDPGALVSGTAVQFPIGLTTVLYNATDTQGNVGTCSVTVEVADNEAPQLTCPINIELPTDFGSATRTIDLPVPIHIADNSGDAPSLTTTVDGVTVITSYDFPIGTTIVTYTATDAANQTSVCDLEVNVLDTEVPILSCPASSTHTTDRGEFGPPGSGFATVAIIGSDATVTDNSGEMPLIIASIDGNPITTATTQFPIGVTTVLFTSVDTNSNDGNCSLTVTVVDDEAPVLTCPSNVTVLTTANSDSALSGLHLATVTLEDATVIDNSGASLEVVRDTNATEFDIGISQVTFSAVDPEGLVGNCTVFITVLDREPPILSCPPNVTFNLANDGTSYRDVDFETDVGIATVTDNNDLVSTPVAVATASLQGSSSTVLSGLTRFHCCVHSPTIVTYTATDVDGNVGTCIVGVRVEDVQEPQLTCTEDLLSLTTDANPEGGVGFAYHYTLVLPPVITDNSNEVLLAVALVHEAERIEPGLSIPTTGSS